jgi:single-stranded DNA-binding protein
MYNRVILLGQVGDKGVTVRPQTEGTMVGNFLLKLSETNDAGRVFTAYHLVECYGKALSVAETLEPGDTILVDGKLRRRKLDHPERWDTAVVALTITRLSVPVAREG